MPIQPKQQPPYYSGETATKTYIALLNQTGTNPPTATILKNTIGTLTYQYTGPGQYQIDTFEGEPYFIQKLLHRKYPVSKSVFHRNTVLQ